MTLGKTSGVAAVMICTALVVGCERRPAGQAADTGASAQQLPFDRPSTKAGISPTGPLAPEAVPAGTEITVRLRSALSSETSHAGDTFEAVLDEPIAVRGQTVAPQGAKVKGKVLDANPSGRLQNSGYLRVTLTSMLVNGASVPVQTASIFAKGGSHEKPNAAVIGSGKGALVGTSSVAGGGVAYNSGNKDVTFSPEHRLTFRLTHALTM